MNSRQGVLAWPPVANMIDGLQEAWIASSGAGINTCDGGLHVQ